VRQTRGRVQHRPVADIIALGATSGPRHESFVAACIDQRGRPPLAVSWDAFLGDPAMLDAALHPGAYLRIDTPDQDVAAIAALYRAGEAAARAAGLETLPPGSEARLAAGDIGSPAQLCFGLVAGVETAASFARRHGALTSTTPLEVACAFDKTATLERLRAAGIAVPRNLLPVTGFDELVAAMEAAHMPRVFVKLRHGSAAAGMIALARNGGQWIAVTTAEPGEDGRIRATRNIRRLTDRLAIARLIDRLVPLGLHVEAWLPKIGIAGRVADIRLVMLADGSVYPVLRTSRHPMTNLHLGGMRGPVDPLIERIGQDAWQAVLATARKAAGCFPDSHVLGLDIAILADGRRNAVLEANVFGDFVKDVRIDGFDPHQAQVRAITARLDALRMAA
jgi:glutathione synthase/RimK-type ligase-like ATP-grasp enzyme